MDRLHGDDSDIVEHIPDIQSFDSFDSEAGNLHMYTVNTLSKPWLWSV